MFLFAERFFHATDGCIDDGVVRWVLLMESRRRQRLCP